MQRKEMLRSVSVLSEVMEFKRRAVTEKKAGRGKKWCDREKDALAD